MLQTVENLMELSSVTTMDPELVLRHRDLYLRILKTLQDPRAFGTQWTNKHVTLYDFFLKLFFDLKNFNFDH